MSLTGNAYWTEQDEDKLVEYLYNNRSRSGDGGSFRKPVFQEVSNILTPLRKKGGPKTVKACQNKWATLKRAYNVVLALKGVSGWTWDDKYGANITPELESSWAAYVKVHKDAEPFKRKGWRHFHRVSEIIPSVVIRGTRVYRASNATTGLSRDRESEDRTPRYGTRRASQIPNPASAR
ncbi:hypothetical protein DXG01_016695 [Tephrocybe rancida]|nr:hypothetical protein DXG01_016695 [Tephrocybe rancida]